MSHPLGKSIRSATVNYDTDKLNILTFPTHERYETGICLTGHNFYAAHNEGIKTWNSNYAPVPPNYTLFDGALQDQQLPIDIDFDLIMTQNKFAHFKLATHLAAQYHLPILTLEHCVPSDDNWHPDMLKQAREMISEINVHTTHYSLEAWKFDEDNDKFPVIYHGIDMGLFHICETVERTVPVLSVCNAMASRPQEVGFELWQTVAQKLVGKIKLVGDNPGLSESAASVKDLVKEYQQAKVFLNTTLVSTIPTCLLEAMACGCAVVTTGTCMIPEVIEHGVNGFMADDVDTLTGYVKQLLDDDELRLKMGQAAKETIAEKFDLDRHVSEWDQVLRRAARKFYKG